MTSSTSSSVFSILTNYLPASPKWLNLLLHQMSIALPFKQPQPITSRYDSVFTIIMLILLFYMTLGSLFRHMKEGVDAEKEFRTYYYSGYKLFIRYYGGLTLLATSILFMLDTGGYILTTVNQGHRTASTPPRLSSFWTVNFLLLYIDIIFMIIACLRPVSRLFTYITVVPAKEAKRILLSNSITNYIEQLGDLETTELLLTRIGMLGGCYILAIYGK